MSTENPLPDPRERAENVMMQQFFTDTWRKYYALYLGFLVALAVTLVLGIVGYQFVGILLLTLMGMMVFHAYLYVIWRRSWQGRIWKKYQQRGETGSIYMIAFKYARPKSLDLEEWQSVRVGDYIVKKACSYDIEVQRK